MADKHKFERRFRRFSATRRGLLNATLAYHLASLALATGVVGLVTLGGWLPNAFCNLGLAAILAIFWLALGLTYLLRWARFRSCLREAFAMEELAGDLDSRLVSGWDFLEQELASPLVGAVIARAGQDLEGRFEERLDRGPRNLWRRRAAIWLVVFLALGSTPWFGWARVAGNLGASWLAAYEYLFPMQYELVPEAGRYVHRLGDKVEVALHFQRRGYQRVRLAIREDEQTKRWDLAVDAEGWARHTITRNVETQLTLWFEFGERQSKEVVLVFTTLPVLVNMQTELIYPTYTRMLPRSLEGVQQRLMGLPGTQITLGFTFSKELASATIDWDDGEDLPLDTLGRFATVSLLHHRQRRANLQVVDTHGLSLEYPLTLEFALQKDEKPRLFLPRHLRRDMPMLTKQLELFGFGVRLQDDYGVTRCLLKWQKGTVDNPTQILARGEIERIISPARRKAVINFEKVFAGIALVPGDRVSFQIEVQDNRAPKKQTTRSRTASFFIFQQELGGLSISQLGFGRGRNYQRARIAKARRTTSVKEPEGLRTREKVRNEFEGAVASTVEAPVVRGEHGQATRDYFRLLSGLRYDADANEDNDK